MKLYIDGDGSPVKDVAIKTAQQAGIEVVVVTSIDHFSQKEYPDNVSFVYVDKGADSADYRIVQLIQKGDWLITQDYGLASLALPKGVRVFHQLGFEYTAENIDQMLNQRYLSAMVRKSGKHTKGPKPFTAKDREEFQRTLAKELAKEQNQ